MATQASKRAITDQAYSAIRADIVSGALEEGERLTEERLSNALGFSRTPVREALRRLIIEGFIERQSGYDTRVARFPVDEMEQIFHIRQLLEAYAAERAAHHATEEEIARLMDHSDTILRHSPPTCTADYEVISQANQGFHQTVVQAARSPRLLAVMSVAFDVGMVTRTYRLYSEEELMRSARHHREIAEAIAARAPEWAAAAMQTHIRAAEAAASRSSIIPAAQQEE